MSDDMRVTSLDDELLAELRRVASAVDGPPDSVREAARAAFLTRDVDGELALLTGDSRSAAGFESSAAGFESSAAGFESSGVGFENSGVGFENSAAGFETVRAEPAPAQGHWLLSFAGGGVQVDMEVSDQAGRISLVGQFVGSSGDDCVLETPGGRRSIDVDDLGRFIVDGLAHGPIRLRCRAADGAPVTTVWVTI